MICRDMTAACAALGRTPGLAARQAAHRDATPTPTLADKSANLDRPVPGTPGTQLGVETPFPAPPATQFGADTPLPGPPATQFGADTPLPGPLTTQFGVLAALFRPPATQFGVNSPVLGRPPVPVRQAAKIAPSEYMSVAGVTGPPLSCSGAV